MPALLSVTGRLLWARGPLLVALYVAGWAARSLIIELAGYLGAHNATLGVLVLPIAVLARLASFVAMFLVVRDWMPALSTLLPSHHDPRLRRAEFRDALLSAILPFSVFYAAWGLLRTDAVDYYERVLQVNTELMWEGVANQTEQAGDGAVGELSLGPLTMAVIVLAFAARWALRRWKDNLPTFFSVFSAYLEALWVWLSMTLLRDLFESVREWFLNRDLVQWFSQTGSGFSWLLDQVGWLWDQVGDVVVLPMAWLVIAAIIYGRAAATQSAESSEKLLRGTTNIASRVSSRAGAATQQASVRMRPIVAALMPIWHAGPLLIGGYLLGFGILVALQGWVEYAFIRSLGPHDLVAFWITFSRLLLFVAPMLFEPIRIAFIAGSYDAMLRPVLTQRAPEENPAHDPGPAVPAGGSNQPYGVVPTANSETVQVPSQYGVNPRPGLFDVDQEPGEGR